VAVRSAGVGRGAEFVLGFPILAVEPPHLVAVQRAASAPQPAAAVAGEATGQQRLAGMRLLVVDDEADVRAVLDSLFSAEGARVVSAASAEEAMERLRFQRMDAVLSDVGMPGTDGYALARRIRALRVHESESATPAAVPLIAFTAFSREEDAHRALDSGFDAHVAKPAELERLIAVLRRCAGPSPHLPIEVAAR